VRQADAVDHSAKVDLTPRKIEHFHGRVDGKNSHHPVTLAKLHGDVTGSAPQVHHPNADSPPPMDVPRDSKSSTNTSLTASKRISL
jgi:hypothetical protein